MDQRADPDRRREPLFQTVERMRCGDHKAFAIVMRQHNQRLFRIARAILKNDSEAEDIVQEAYIKVFTGIDTLRETAGFGPWISRITANLAISRVRQKNRQTSLVLDATDDTDSLAGLESDPGCQSVMTPERAAAIGEIRRLIENEIDALADGFREVFVLRVVEGMSIEETADALNIPAQTVKTRLHRARRNLRDALEIQVNKSALNAFPFLGERCDRIVERVIGRLTGQGIAAPAQGPH